MGFFLYCSSDNFALSDTVMMHSADMTEEIMCLEIDIYYIENWDLNYLAIN
jgi:hypothetical protein